MANAWHTGPGSPAAAVGEDTDHFLDLDTSRIFRKTDGTWRQIGILRAVGRGPTWLTGSGTPTAALGDNGDMYLDVATGHAYQKMTDSWFFLSELRGVAGAAGATPASVTVAPDSVEIPGTIGGPRTTLCEVAVPEPGPSIVLGKFVASYWRPTGRTLQSGASVSAALGISETTFLDQSETMLASNGEIVIPGLWGGTNRISVAGSNIATISLMGWYNFGSGQMVRMSASRSIGTDDDQVVASHCRLVVFRHM